MFIVIVCLSADPPGLVRVDHSSFSQQALMEMLADGLHGNSALRDDDGAFKAIAEWPWVWFSATGEVQTINWNDNAGFLQYGGQIDLRYMPSTVTNFLLYAHTISGTIETSVLPDALVKLHVVCEVFHGTIDFTTLPAAIKNVVLSENMFTGTVDLTRLPSNLRILEAPSNKFHGSLRFENLPEHITTLVLHDNDFTGDVTVIALPSRLIVLSVTMSPIQKIIDASGEEFSDGRIMVRPMSDERALEYAER